MECYFAKNAKNCLRPKNKITKSGRSKLTYHCSKCNFYYNNKSKQNSNLQYFI